MGKYPNVRKKCVILILAAGYFEKMHEKLFKNERHAAHMQYLNKIFYVYVINSKVWYCLFSQKMDKTTIG